MSERSSSSLSSQSNYRYFDMETFRRQICKIKSQKKITIKEIESGYQQNKKISIIRILNEENYKRNIAKLMKTVNIKNLIKIINIKDDKSTNNNNSDDDNNEHTKIIKNKIVDDDNDDDNEIVNDNNEYSKFMENNNNNNNNDDDDKILKNKTIDNDADDDDDNKIIKNYNTITFNNLNCINILLNHDLI